MLLSKQQFSNAVKACAALSFLLSALPASAQTVAWYRFNDGSNGQTVSTITDSGPNGLNGVSAGTTDLTYTNNVPSSPNAGSGALNASDSFNFARVDHHVAMEVQGDLTVEIFFFMNPGYTYSGDGIADELVVKQNNSGFGDFLSAWVLYVVPVGGQNRLSTELGYAGGAGTRMTQSSGSITTGVWHHAAMVLDRDFSGNLDSYSIYLDGVQVAQTLADLPDLDYGNTPLYIGAGNYGADPNGVGIYRRNFDGLIDEVRISSAALSPSQFLNAPVTVPEAGTLALLGLALVPVGFGLARRRK